MHILYLAFSAKKIECYVIFFFVNEFNKKLLRLLSCLKNINLYLGLF